jgi:protein FRA10AC1
MRYMNPYDIHKALINDYVLKRPGDTQLLQRDGSKDRTDHDVLRQNHRFLWDESTPDTWEAQFAKKYYDKLFKEYCIGDLSLFKDNKIALRWRIEQEVITGKGQFICGNKKCTEKEELKTWEVNFAYREQGEKKNALVKISKCECF